MTIPPTTVNRYITHIDVLHSLGVEVKSSLPTISSCPSCGGQMDVTDDPIGGAWFHCHGCKFSGDSIELYQYVKKLSSVNVAINEMLTTDIAFQGKKLDIAIDYYTNTIWPERTMYNDFWESAKDRLSKMKPEGVRLMNMYGVYTGYPDQSNGLLGCAHREDIDLLPTSEQLKLQGHTLIVSFQDQPQRHRGFYFMASKNKQWLKELNIRPGGDMEYHDDGLAFLNALPTRPSIIYVVDSVPLGLMLQLRYGLKQGKQLPLVVCSDNTTYAWQTIKALTGEVIFWAPEITNTILNNALRAYRQNIFVRLATKPAQMDLENPLKLKQQINDYGVIKFIADMQRTARPLMEVIRDHTHMRNVPTTELISDVLAMDAGEVGELLSLYSEIEAKVIRKQLYSPAAERIIKIDGRRVADREDGWYHIRAQGDVHQISNVKLVIEKLIRLSKSNRTLCEGRLIIDGNDIPFSDDTKNVRKNTVDWIEARVLDAGIGVIPKINMAWHLKLYNVSLELYLPKTHTVDETVGWNDAQGWWSFPAFRIHDTKIELLPRLNTLSNDTRPCRKIVPPIEIKPERMDQLIEDTGINRGLWGTMAVILHNMLVPIKHWQPFSFGVVAPQGLDKHPIISWLMRTLDLPVCNHKERAQLSSIVTATKKYNIPSILNISETKLMKVIPESIYASIITCVSENVAEVGVLYDGWVFLSGDIGLDEDPNFEQAEQIIPLFLSWLHSQQYMLPDNPGTLDRVLGALQVWVSETYSIPALATHGASEVLLQGGTENVKSQGEHIIRLIIRLLCDHSLQISNKGKPLIGYDDKHVPYVYMQTALSKLHALGYPVPPLMEVTRRLVSADALLPTQQQSIRTFKPDWWNACVKRLRHDMTKARTWDPEVLYPLFDPESVEDLLGSPNSGTSE